MKLKRNPIAYAIVRKCTDGYIQGAHKISFEGTQSIPREGPGLIIPKHQYMRDIPLEGYILNKSVKRPASWIMKYSLPKCFEKIGAIRVYRQKDIRKQLKELTNKNEKQDFKEKVRQTNEQVAEYIKFLYQNNELIILHAEGTRNLGAMSPINMPLINYTKQLQEELGIKIPLLLMGITYRDIKTHNSKVSVNIKQLDWNTPNLEGTISKELAELSNI